MTIFIIIFFLTLLLTSLVLILIIRFWEKTKSPKLFPVYNRNYGIRLRSRLRTNRLRFIRWCKNHNQLNLLILAMLIIVVILLLLELILLGAATADKINIKNPIITPVPLNFLTSFILPFIVALLGICLGTFLFIKEKKLGGVLLTLLSFLLSSGSLFSVSLELPPIKVCFFDSEENTIQYIESVHMGKVGPFVTAVFDILECDGDEKLEKFLKGIKKYDKNKIVFLNVIGRYDKRKLRNEKLEEYGTNISLAQARANWVRDTIAAITKFPKDKIITSIEGPFAIGDNLDSASLSADRCVNVYALIREENNREN